MKAQGVLAIAVCLCGGYAGQLSPCVGIISTPGIVTTRDYSVAAEPPVLLK